jgi:Na+/H+ antiporter NhaC
MMQRNGGMLMFNAIIIVSLIVWVIKQLCSEFGISKALSKKINRRINSGD